MIFNLSLLLIILLLYFFTHLKNSYSKQKKDYLFLRITFIIFFILVSFRAFNIGNDTLTYLNFFEKCAKYKWEIVSFDGYYEGGYIILNILISYISSHPRFFLIVMSLIFNFVIYKFIEKNSKNYLLSVIMYVCLLFFYSSMTMMRQFFAMTIILYSFSFVKKQQLLKFLFFVIIASLFHSSAWIAILCYPMYNLKYSNKMAVFILVVATICCIYIGPVVSIITNLIGRENYYAAKVGSDSISNTIYFLIYLIMFFFSLYQLLINKKLKNKDISFYLYSMLFAAAINLIGTNMNILSRAADYFSIFIIISFPNVIEETVVRKYDKKILNILLLLCFVSYSSVIIFYKPEWNSAFNYSACLIKNEGDLCE